MLNQSQMKLKSNEFNSGHHVKKKSKEIMESEHA